MLYDFIEKSNGYFVCSVEKKYHSRMNVTFRIPQNKALEAKLIKEAEFYKIVNIAGHPFNPGVRISMYNAMPVEGVIHLCKFLLKFIKENPVTP